LHRVALLLRERRHRWAGSAGRGIWHGCKVAIVMAAARTAGSWRTLPSVAGVTSTPQDVVSTDPCHNDSPSTRLARDLPAAALIPGRGASGGPLGSLATRMRSSSSAPRLPTSAHQATCTSHLGADRARKMTGAASRTSPSCTSTLSRINWPVASSTAAAPC
jgi:hypothetical protein